MKNGIFAKTDMADAAILTFKKPLSFPNRSSNRHQVSFGGGGSSCTISSNFEEEKFARKHPDGRRHLEVH